MPEFSIRQEQIIYGPIDQVFTFFADAQKLPLLIPDWISFCMTSPGPVRMAPGTHIDYAVRLHGIPFGWQSEITAWQPPHRFVDEQRKGPFRCWIHTHTFEAVAAGRTLVRDVVRYGVPGGRVINKLLVAPDLSRIFAHRRRQLQEIFPEEASEAPRVRAPYDLRHTRARPADDNLAPKTELKRSSAFGQYDH